MTTLDLDALQAAAEAAKAQPLMLIPPKSVLALIDRLRHAERELAAEQARLEWIEQRCMKFDDLDIRLGITFILDFSLFTEQDCTLRQAIDHQLSKEQS